VFKCDVKMDWSLVSYLSKLFEDYDCIGIYLCQVKLNFGIVKFNHLGDTQAINNHYMHHSMLFKHQHGH